MSLNLNHSLYKHSVSVAVFLFFTLTLAIPSGYSYGSALLLLTSLIAFASTQRRILLANALSSDWRLAALFLSLFIIAVIAALYHGDSANIIDQPSRYLLAIPIIFLLRTIPVSPRAIWIGLILGAISAASLSYWQLNFGIDPASGMHFDRATGFVTSAIPFGAIALSMGLMNLAGLPWASAQPRHSRLWQTALCIGFLAGSYASLKSGSRGSWIALAPAIILIIFSLGRHLRAHTHLLLFLVALATILLTIQVNETAQSRYQLAKKQFYSYFSEHTVLNSSVGERLETWRAALINISERPLTGWSRLEYQTQLAEQIARKEISPEVAALANTHNNYLEICISQGLVGLLALLSLFIYSFFHFLSDIRNEDPTLRSFSLAGAILVVSIACFGLTYVILGRNNGVVFFTISLIVFWAGPRTNKPALRNKTHYLNGSPSRDVTIRSLPGGGIGTRGS